MIGRGQVLQCSIRGNWVAYFPTAGSLYKFGQKVKVRIIFGVVSIFWRTHYPRWKNASISFALGIRLLKVGGPIHSAKNWKTTQKRVRTGFCSFWWGTKARSLGRESAKQWPPKSWERRKSCYDFGWVAIKFRDIGGVKLYQFGEKMFWLLIFNIEVSTFFDFFEIIWALIKNQIFEKWWILMNE